MGKGRQWALAGWKAHGKNGWGKTTPNGKWPNVSGEGQTGFSPRALPGRRAVCPWCSVLWHYAAASQDLSCFRAWGWAPTQQCSSLWIWINSQKSKNCGISPLNAVPREGSIISFPEPTRSREEWPGKMFSKKLNYKILSGALNTSTLKLASKKAVFSHHC